MFGSPGRLDFIQHLEVRFVPANIGIHTADAEQVKLALDGCDLVLRYVDWQKQPQECVFRDVLGFRWNGEFDEDQALVRDDTTYEVLDSEWLARQANLHAEPADSFAHYKLCFNACGVLDVICRRLR